MSLSVLTTAGVHTVRRDPSEEPKTEEEETLEDTISQGQVDDGHRSQAE